MLGANQVTAAQAHLKGEHRSGFKNPHVFVVQAFQKFVHQVQNRGFRSALPGCGSTWRFATLHSMAKHSSEEPAAPGMSTELQTRSTRCDSEHLAPRRGQDLVLAAWMRRALPSSYRRLLPARLGESLCLAKPKSNPTQMEMSKHQMPWQEVGVGRMRAKKW